MQVAGVQEDVVVTAEAPLVQTTQQSARRQPLEPRDRRRAVELPQLHRADAARARHHAEPGGVDVRRRPGRRQRHAVAAERLSDRRHVQQRRPPRRQPGHAGARRARQHRGVPGAVESVQRRVRRRRRRHHQHDHARRHQRTSAAASTPTSATTGSTRADTSFRPTAPKP